MKIKIDVVSDVACPWCYVGMKRLQKALDLVPEIQAEAYWQPFQLDPSVPAEGRELKDYYAAKFGGEEQAYRVFENMENVGRGEGINYDFRKMSRTMNTLPLHVLMLQADAEGFKTVLKARFFKAYFEDRINLAVTEHVVTLAESIGLDTAKAREILTSDLGTTEVDQLLYQNRLMGISGVPYYIINDKYAVSGAQPTELFLEALPEIAVKAPIQAPAEGEACDIETGVC